jgi:hypothetical protein
MMDVQHFNEAFYAIPAKQSQDAFILKFCRMSSPDPKRKRPDADRGKELVIEYTVPNAAGNHLKVCRETFLGILGITKHRVLGIFKRFKKDKAMVPVETRGGDRMSAKFEAKKSAVIAFICSFSACESHYARSKSNRVYLPSELNITKMWRMYLENRDNDLFVKESYFRKIFVENFNIGFSAPSVDECSTCLELKSRIECEKDDTKKEDLQLKLKVHKKRASGFFEYLRKKPDDCYLLSFDCQKNLPLAVVKGKASDCINPQNVHLYTWTEDEGKKSSNEIAAAIFHALRSADLTSFTRIRLVADGCPGQNKNVNVLTMCAKWLVTYAPSYIEEIELIFPLTGHSFLPADRVFGLIERILKKKTAIITREEYYKVFERFGTLQKLGRDWQSQDWKVLAKENTKTAAQLHFKISMCRRIILTKTQRGGVQIWGEQTYNADQGVCKPFQKKNSRLHNAPIPMIPIGVPVKAEKLVDVQRLLAKHFGDEWSSRAELQWYSSVLEAGGLSVGVSDECECSEFGSLEEDEDNF